MRGANAVLQRLPELLTPPRPPRFPVDVTAISPLQFVQLLELSSVIGAEPLRSARGVPVLQAASSPAAS